MLKHTFSVQRQGPFHNPSRFYSKIHIRSTLRKGICGEVIIEHVVLQPQHCLRGVKRVGTFPSLPLHLTA